MLTLTRGIPTRLKPLSVTLGVSLHNGKFIRTLTSRPQRILWHHCTQDKRASMNHMAPGPIRHRKPVQQPRCCHCQLAENIPLKTTMSTSYRTFPDLRSCGLHSRNSRDGCGSMPHGGILHSPVVKRGCYRTTHDMDFDEAAYNISANGNHCKMKQATCQVRELRSKRENN